MTISRLFEVLEYQRKYYPQRDALAYKYGGCWKQMSIETLMTSVENIAFSLLKMGLKPGDRVAIVSANCPEWLMLDYGIQLMGGISVPIYSTVTEEDYHFIFKHAQVQLVFVEEKNLYAKVTRALQKAGLESRIYTFKQEEGLPHWKEILVADTELDRITWQMLGEQVDEDDLVTIIYTSGTTGTPKGVMLSHRNILSNALAAAAIFPLPGSKSRTLSFLPLCHIFERTALVMAIYLGVSIYFAESLETVSINLKEVKPNYFSAVPRLLEKSYEKLLARGESLKGLSHSIFKWSLSLSNSYQLPVGNNWIFRTKLQLARWLIFRKWKLAMGGELQFIVCGAAALNSTICKAFWTAGIPVLEAYGLTEASPGVTFTRLNHKTARIGYCGQPLEGVYIKFSDDREILVKGPNVMKGYYRSPDLTEITIDADGWLHTGDVGEMDHKFRLRITDRKKEMFKTSGGKYIAPQILENHFKSSKYIDQIMVVGEGKKFPAALVIPVFQQLEEWSKTKGIVYQDLPELLTHPETNQLFKTIFDKLNKKFARYEQLKKFALLANAWTIETGELTPTLKLKRSTIFKNNLQLIDSFYN